MWHADKPWPSAASAAGLLSLSLPAGLRSLSIHFGNFTEAVEQVVYDDMEQRISRREMEARLRAMHAASQSWIDAAAQCSKLHTLQLRDFPPREQTSLQPLLLLSQTSDSPLRHLRLEVANHSEGTEWTSAHIATLRAMVSLQTLEVAALPQPLIDTLLATPHSLCWRTFECAHGGQSKEWSALQHVPTLTRLGCRCGFPRAHASTAGAAFVHGGSGPR